MSRRRLAPDEVELWHRVAASTKPLHPPGRPAAAKPAQPLMPAPKATPEPFASFTVGQTAAAPPSYTARKAVQPPAMDAKAFQRLRRGKLAPEGRIDLHGMTLAEAHPALTGFILTSQLAGKRLVLVITGKGKPGNDWGAIPRRRGILHDQVPQWLRMAPLAQAVLEISQAHARHGGGGALYVYLRKLR